MSGSSSKNKGKSGERDVCKTLGEIFNGTFIRVPNSGAYVGGQNASRKQILHDNQIWLAKGDVIPPPFMKKFVVECKFYKDFAFHSLVRENVPALDGWIQQTIDCVDPGDFWFLCIKINRRGSFVVFDVEHKDHFVLGNYTKYKTFIFTDMDTFFKTNRDKILELVK